MLLRDRQARQYALFATVGFGVGVKLLGRVGKKRSKSLNDSVLEWSGAGQSGTRALVRRASTNHDAGIHIPDSDFDPRPVLPGTEPLEPPMPLSTVVIDDIFDSTPPQLFSALLRQENSFLTQFLEVQDDIKDPHVHPWKYKDGTKTRLVFYEKMTGNRMAPVAQTTEQWKIIEEEDGGFVLDITAMTPNVPFGNAFHNAVQLACWLEPNNKSRLRVSIQVNFTGTVGFLKGAIRGSSIKGMTKWYEAMRTTLHEYVGTHKSTEPVPVQAAAKGTSVEQLAVPSRYLWFIVTAQFICILAMFAILMVYLRSDVDTARGPMMCAAQAPPSCSWQPDGTCV